MPCFTNIAAEQLAQLKKLLEDMEDLLESGRLELVPNNVLGAVEFELDGEAYEWEGGWADTCIMAELMHHGSVDTYEKVHAATHAAGMEVSAHV